MSEQVPAGATDEALPEYEPVPDDAMPREHLAALEAVPEVIEADAISGPQAGAHGGSIAGPIGTGCRAFFYRFPPGHHT